MYIEARNLIASRSGKHKLEMSNYPIGKELRLKARDLQQIRGPAILSECCFE